MERYDSNSGFGRRASGDEDWWIEAYGDGVHGRVRVGDVEWDESGRTHAIGIAVPIRSTAGDGVAGVLKVVSDSREMFAVLAGIRPGESGEATLVREDGSIVFRRGSPQGDTHFFAASLLRERVRTLKAGDPQTSVMFTARAADVDDRYLVGIAPSQLGASYPNLHWLIAVSQAESELFAPIRQQAVHLLVLILTVAIAVLGIALWFSMRLTRPAFETDMHLVDHARIPHIDDEDEDERDPAVSFQRS